MEATHSRSSALSVDPSDHVPGHPLLLRARDITKQYGGTRALDGAELEVRAGEIHGLLGENGSGKSTFIKVLAGVVAPDAGSLKLFDDDVSFPLAPGESHRRGLRFVHQSLGLIPSLDIAENLLVERFALARRSGYIDWRRFYDDAAELLDRYGLKLDPRRPLAELAPIDRSLVAIVRAVATGTEPDHSAAPRLLVLDEPTVFLPRGEVARIFDMLRGPVASGAGVLFVSHRMDEVREYTDRVTVLRDGRNAGTRVTAEVDDSALVRLIVGSQVTPSSAGLELADEHNATVVEVTGFASKSLRHVDLTVRSGEIVGLTGLAGSGYEEILYGLFGAHTQATGTLNLHGRELALRKHTPRAAIAAGIALIPADRLRDGVSGTATVEENLTLNVVGSFFRTMLLRRRELRRRAGELARDYRVRPPNVNLTVDCLSGGNQQKVLLAKWLVGEPSLILLHEPTQGVDVGARADIAGFLQRLASSGASIVIASAEYEQLASLCTRVVIFRDGRASSVLEREDVTKERILSECLRGSAQFAGDQEGGSS
jgi:ribose transport system ATP-binding protein